MSVKLSVPLLLHVRKVVIFAVSSPLELARLVHAPACARHVLVYLCIQRPYGSEATQDRSERLESAYKDNLAEEEAHPSPITYELLDFTVQNLPMQW